ncbi:hypothetical protein FKM82_005440 [Ascaphus truei]
MKWWGQGLCVIQSIYSSLKWCTISHQNQTCSMRHCQDCLAIRGPLLRLVGKLLENPTNGYDQFGWWHFESDHGMGFSAATGKVCSII